MNWNRLPIEEKWRQWDAWRRDRGSSIFGHPTTNEEKTDFANWQTDMLKKTEIREAALSLARLASNEEYLTIFPALLKALDGDADAGREVLFAAHVRRNV